MFQRRGELFGVLGQELLLDGVGVGEHGTEAQRQDGRHLCGTVEQPRMGPQVLRRAERSVDGQIAHQRSDLTVGHGAHLAVGNSDRIRLRFDVGGHDAYT